MKTIIKRKEIVSNDTTKYHTNFGIVTHVKTKFAAMCQYAPDYKDFNGSHESFLKALERYENVKIFL